MKTNYQGNANKGGVYQIKNLVNGRMYFGSCKEFKKRFASHRHHLIANRHGNRFLQADFNKCGSDAFVFEVMKVVEGSKEERLNEEQLYITKHFDCGQTCYNLRKKASDSREGKGNNEATNPSTDKRCQSPSQETLSKRSEGLKKAFEENPELREQCAKRAKEVRWKEHSVNITVTHKDTKEIVVITGSLREWCLGRGLSYKAFHQLVRGKIKSSNGWFLGTEQPVYIERKGEKRAPLTSEHRAKIAGSRFVGVKLTNKLGQELFVSNNVKDQCKELGLYYTTFLKMLKGTCKTCGGWFVTDN